MGSDQMAANQPTITGLAAGVPSTRRLRPPVPIPAAGEPPAAPSGCGARRPEVGGGIAGEGGREVATQSARKTPTTP